MSTSRRVVRLTLALVLIGGGSRAVASHAGLLSGEKVAQIAAAAAGSTGAAAVNAWSATADPRNERETGNPDAEQAGALGIVPERSRLRFGAFRSRLLFRICLIGEP